MLMLSSKSVTASRIEQNLKVVQLSKEDVGVFNGMAASGKQKRVNTPAWGHDLVSSPSSHTVKGMSILTYVAGI